jgi:dimeric dUTPase (all-alpha-NTP-PPase superfamily)
MSMDFKKFLEMQNELDSFIMQNKTIDNKTLLSKRILACIVELGEYANETKCFKYWSDKKASDKEIRLEEFIDVLHFIFSIANLECFSAEDIEDMYKKKYEINIQRQKEGY